MREFDTGATRDTDEGKFDYEGFLCPLALERYAAYMHAHRKQADGNMRDSDNWQRGLPVKECVKSMFRHFVDLWKLNRNYAVVDQKDDGYIDMEETCCAIIFNAFSILSTKQKEKLQIPEIIPQRVDLEEWKNAKDGDSVRCVCAPSTFPPTQYGGDE